MLKTPSSVLDDHDGLHEWLMKIKSSGGKTGEAAKLLGNILHPHAVHENEYAMPVLSLLPEIAQGAVTPEMRPAIRMAEHVKADMHRMLEEHKMIVQAADALAAAAIREQKPDVAKFVEHIKSHLRAEEEVLYPAAILVGEYLKAKLEKH